MYKRVNSEKEIICTSGVGGEVPFIVCHGVSTILGGFNAALDSCLQLIGF